MRPVPRVGRWLPFALFVLAGACDDFTGVEVDEVLVRATPVSLGGSTPLDVDMVVQVTIENHSDLALELDPDCGWTIEMLTSGDPIVGGTTWVTAYTPGCKSHASDIRTTIPPRTNHALTIEALEGTRRSPIAGLPGIYRVKLDMDARFSVVRTIPVSEPGRTSSPFEIT